MITRTLIAIVCLGATTSVAHAASTFALFPAPGARSSCSMVVSSEVTGAGRLDQGGLSRDLAISAGGDQVVFDLKTEMKLERQTGNWAFNVPMSKSTPVRLDARDISRDMGEVAIFAASFPEAFLYGANVTVGQKIPMPKWRSEYADVLLNSGIIVEDIDRDLVLTREEVFDGAPVYVIEGSIRHKVTFSDGARHEEVAGAIYRLDKSTLLLRQASLERTKDYVDAAGGVITHANEAEWTCSVSS